MVLFVWGEQYIKPTDMTYGLKFNAEAKAHGFQDGDQMFMIDNDTVEAWSVALVREISNAKTVTVKRGAGNVTLNMPENMNMLTMLEEPRYVSELIPMCVDTVIPGTPAETIGLKKGDAITSINGTAIADHNELLWQMASLRQTVDENSIANDSLNARTVSLVINGTDTVTAVLSPDFTLGFVSAIPDYKISKKELEEIQSEDYPACAEKLRNNSENKRIKEALNLCTWTNEDKKKALLASRYLNSIGKGENALALSVILKNNLEKQSTERKDFIVPKYIKDALVWLLQ